MGQTATADTEIPGVSCFVFMVMGPGKVYDELGHSPLQ